LNINICHKYVQNISDALNIDANAAGNI